MSTSAISVQDIVTQKGNTMQDTKAQVKSIDDFTGLDQLSGLQKREREALESRGFSLEELLKMGRAVAHDLDNGTGDYNEPRRKYMQSLAKALDRAGYIRHDLDVMILRQLWLYSTAVDSNYYPLKGEDPWQLHWFNWAYETLDQDRVSAHKRAFNRGLKLVRDYFDFYNFQPHWFDIFVRWFGLDDATKLPGRVLYPEILTADHDQQVQSGLYDENRNRLAIDDSYSYLYDTDEILVKLCSHLPTFRGACGHESHDKWDVRNHLHDVEEILTQRYFTAYNDDEIRERLIRLAGMDYGPNTKPPTTELAIDELWLPADIHDHLKQAGLRKVSDLQQPGLNDLDVKGMKRKEWDILRAALVFRGFLDIADSIHHY